MFEIGFSWIYLVDNDTFIQTIIDTTRIDNYFVYVLNNGTKFSYKEDSIILFFENGKTYLYKPNVSSWSDTISNRIFVYNSKIEDRKIIVEQKIFERNNLKSYQILEFNLKLLNIRRILKYPYEKEWILIGYKQPTIDKILNFLLNNLTSYGTFKAYEKFKYGAIEMYNSTFYNAFLIDVFKNWLYFSPIKDSLENISLNSILKYKKGNYIWTYWIDREIAPDFDDISLHSIALNIKNYNTDENKHLFKNYFKNECYLTWIGDSLIPIKWLGSIIDNRECDCIVNLNIFRYLKDKNLCLYLKKCYNQFNQMKDKWYLDPGFWFLYFYSKSYIEGNICKEINVKEKVLELLKNYKNLTFRQKLLLSASSNVLNIRNNYLDSLRFELKDNLLNDGGMPAMYYTPDNINRILPSLLYIDAIRF
ncbi:MAG: hypothetical protein ABIL78_04765 [candidate division WOR-3 bacterium]